jgi:hypothetical protein
MYCCRCLSAFSPSVLGTLGWDPLEEPTMWIFLFIDDLEYLRKEREGREERVSER